MLFRGGAMVLVLDLPATEAWEVLRAAAMTASLAPTDMPTSADARAARSLMPSPAKMVVLPRPCRNRRRTGYTGEEQVTQKKNRL